MVFNQRCLVAVNTLAEQKHHPYSSPNREWQKKAKHPNCTLYWIVVGKFIVFFVKEAKKASHTFPNAMNRYNANPSGKTSRPKWFPNQGAPTNKKNEKNSFKKTLMCGGNGKKQSCMSKETRHDCAVLIFGSQVCER
jgi:hypothetical protein